MRLDPAQNIEVEMADLRKQIADLKRECESYFRLIEEVRSRRDGWKQHRTMSSYGDRF